jgi:hypothetical protein
MRESRVGEAQFANFVEMVNRALADPPSRMEQHR